MKEARARCSPMLRVLAGVDRFLIAANFAPIGAPPSAEVSYNFGPGAALVRIREVTPSSLTREQVLPGRPDEVFRFFADAANLEAITPPWLRFRIVTPQPIRMEPGALIEYRLRLHGIPIRWLTRIEEWEPGRRFVDAQVKGPYALWRHTHSFEEHPDGTLMRDTVEYALPFGPLGRLALLAFVRRDVERIFDFRAAALHKVK